MPHFSRDVAETVERQSPTVRLGHFFFSFRDYLFPFTFVLFLVTTTPGRPFGSERWDMWIDILGIIIVLFGQGYRLLAAGSAKNIRRRGHDGRIGAFKIIRHGTFAHSRNPLYLGNLLIICGFVVIANNLWWYLLVLPLFIVIYFAIVLAEEEFLLQKFGVQYQEYCCTVNRFVPRLDGLYQTLANSSYDWRQAVGREYGNMCAWGV